MKAAVAVLLAGLAGCANVQQVIGGYQTAAAVSLRAAEDNAIHAWTFAVCATPYSAMLRNPQIIPALRALCGPSVQIDLLPAAAPAYTPLPISQEGKQ